MFKMEEQIQQGKGKFTIVHDKPVCIGCGACVAVNPDFWVMEETPDELKSHLINSEEQGEKEKLDIEEKDYELNKEAADVCPVTCIHLFDKDNKQII